jgi:hypothetical protein
MNIIENAQTGTAASIARDAADISAYAVMVTSHMRTGDGEGARGAYWARMNTMTVADRHVWADECRGKLAARRM